MPEEVLEIFDEDNIPIGVEKRSIIHTRGLFHRTVNIIVVRRGEIFLQQRSDKKDVCPLKWDLSGGEHLKPGEGFEEAAERCLEEELGIKTGLKKIRKVHVQKNEYLGGKIKDYEIVELFLATYSGEIKTDNEEVRDGGFFPIIDIEKRMAENRDEFTPWFADEWDYMKNSGLLEKLSSMSGS